MSRAAEQLLIRQMSAADLPRAIEIARSLKDAPHWPESAWTAALNREAEPRRICLVAANPHFGIIVAFAVAGLLPPQAELESIAVTAGHQRQGVARKLFAALARELAAAGVGEVLLEVRASNQAAQGFYQALGFAKTGLRTGYYADPIEDAVLMSLRLQ